MALVLYDAVNRNALRPFTYNHAIADVVIGLFSIRTWWQQLAGTTVYTSTTNYLQPLYDAIPEGEHIYVDAAVITDELLAQQILSLAPGSAIADANGLIAIHKHSNSGFNAAENNIIQVDTVIRLQHAADIFLLNDVVIRMQFAFMKKRFPSAALSATNTVIGNPDLIWIAPDATVEYATLNTSTGPIFIHNNATIMEGCLIRGPFVLGAHSVVKMGAKIYGATTLGPYCVGGGEIKNVVMMGYSNKAHDGYLGDAVIGEWCNLGAGTSNSNVKNTAGSVKIYHPESESQMDAGLKCGVIMGDYTRTAINTRINTGSFFGLCCNIVTEKFPPKLIPNFTWYNNEPVVYRFDKAVQDITNWKQLKHSLLTDAETSVLRFIFEHSQNQS